MKILLTGATGFIGYRLSLRLIDSGHSLVLLVRNQSLNKIKNLFKSSSKITVIEGDMSQESFSSITEKYVDELKDVESLVHLAAKYDLKASKEESYQHNVQGTRHVISLVNKMDSLKYFHYISTYAVNPLSDGFISEEQIPDQQLIHKSLSNDFRNNDLFSDFYSSTKYEAEILVRNFSKKGLKKRIYRPGIVIGDTFEGAISKIDGPYYFMKIFNFLRIFKFSTPVSILPVSCHENSTLPIIPVNILVSWLEIMISHPTSHENRSYHLISDEKILLLDFLKETLHCYNIPLKVIRIPKSRLYKNMLPLFGIPREIYKYMLSSAQFDKKNIKEDFPELSAPSYKDYLPQIIQGAQNYIS